jgi:caffeoyl-CoA O-methyltransferase
MITIDINAELEKKVRENFAGARDTIEYRIGNALEIIPALNEIFDLVFIDADKSNYINYFDLVIDKVRPGGFILADNVLWSGKVLNKNPDNDTKAIIAFNQKIQHDSRVENVLLPIRDGIMMIRKLSL